jgi:ribosomal protein L4
VKAPVYDLNGEVVEQMELSDAVFALPFNEAVVHQAMVRQLANERQGTASTREKTLCAEAYRESAQGGHKVASPEGWWCGFWS